MKSALAAILLILLCNGCRVSSNDPASPPGAPGRWQVIQTEYGPRNEKQPILLDTYTGETWVQGWDSNQGYIWRRAEKR